MSHYETAFILTPVLSDAQMKKTVDRFTSHLTSAGATTVNDEHWGLRKLAYPIEEKSARFYHFIEFDAKPSVIEPFETFMRRGEMVLRYTTIARDKFRHAHAKKRCALRSNPVAEE